VAHAEDELTVANARPKSGVLAFGALLRRLRRRADDEKGLQREKERSTQGGSVREPPPAAAAFRGKEAAFALQARQTRRGDTRLRALRGYPSGAGSVPCFRRGATLQCLRVNAATGREDEETLMLSLARRSAFHGEGRVEAVTAAPNNATPR
jgi:hypothetical protein